MTAKSKVDPKNKDALVSSERRQGLDPYSLISLIPIQPYHWVADIGCGPGYLAIPLGKYLFGGKVFALDIQQKMLDTTREAAQALHLTNVDTMLMDEEKLPLDDECLDGALLALVLHEADNPTTLLKETLRCLKKSAWLVILEWYKRKMDEGPPVKQRIDQEKLLPMAQKLGFRLSSRRDFYGKHYMLMMRK